MSTKTTLTVAILICIFALARPAPSYAQDCQQVSGRLVETVVVPFLSPNDPFGRVVSHAEGSINAVGTAILTSVAPRPGDPPAWIATTRHAFVVTTQDQLAATGVAQLTSIPGNTTDVDDKVTLTVNGAGSGGRFKGATGTIILTGIGHNVYAPFPFLGPTAGSTFFVFHYEGTVCLADSGDKDK
jgi:hypothetical protein